MRKPPTGEPYAGKLHARFGGRGGETLPDPYQDDGSESALDQCQSRSGSRPLALKMGTLVGAESSRISAAPASFSLAPENRPALKVVTPWMSGGSGPTMSTPGTAINS